MRIWILNILCVVFLSNSCSSVYHVDEADYAGYRLELDKYEADGKVEAVLAPYREEMDAAMNEVLIKSSKSLTLATPESTMGNLAADATEVLAEWYMDQEVDFAIHNYSGIRIKVIGAGDIKLGSIYEMMPFDNYLVTVSITGKEVLELCHFMASRGGWPCSSSLTYEIKDDMAHQVRINGEPVDSEETYVLASNNYVIQSANYVDFFRTKSVTNSGVYVRDAIAEYLRSLHEAGVVLEPKLDQRVTVNQ